MIGAFSSAWTMLRHPSTVWPALAVIAAFSTISVVFMLTASAPTTGIWLTGPLPLLSDLNQASVLSVLVSRQCVIVGVVMVTVAILHVSRQLSSGLIRVELAAQPRRYRWFTGTWAALASAAVAASVFAALIAVVAGYAYAATQGIDTSGWARGIGLALGTLSSLSLGMVAFTFAGAALGLWLRSPISALLVAFPYAVFETAISTLSPLGRGLLPVSAFATTATAGFAGPLQAPSLIAALVFTVALATGAFGLITSRNVTD